MVYFITQIKTLLVVKRDTNNTSFEAVHITRTVWPPGYRIIHSWATLGLRPHSPITKMYKNVSLI